MSINLDVSLIDGKKIEQLMATIKNGAEKVLANSINFSLIRGKRQATKEVTSQYYVDKSEVVKSLYIKKANTSNLQGSVISKSRVLQLYKHKVDVKNGKIFYYIRKDKGPQLRENAFLQKVKSFAGRDKKGDTKYSENDIKTRVFRAKNGKLQAQYGASIPGMLNNEKVSKEIIGYTNEILEERINEVMLNLLSK